MRFFTARRTVLVVAMACLAAALVTVPDQGARADDIAETWISRASADKPSPRTLPAMTYDAARKEVILFGGYGPAGNNPQRTDTWAWDGSAWRLRPVVIAPGFCPAPEMAYDAARQNVVLFCGYGQGVGTLGATWTWNGAVWTLRTTATAPSPRQHYVLAYDTTRGETVLFGGRSNSGSYLNDTWVWNGTSWAQRTPLSSPPARSGAAVAYDALRSELVVFSGTGNGGPLSDTWVWDGSTWTKRATQSAPPARWTATMAYDVSRTGAVLYGGVDVQTNAFFNDTWTWNGASWSQVTTVASPPGRYFAAMAFDEERSQTVLFGGAVGLGTGVKETDDTWTLDSAPGDCAPPSVGELGLLDLVPPLFAARPEPDPCCIEAPTDEKGNVVLPPDATEVEEEDVSVDRGSTAGLYPNHDTEVDTWYGEVECPWSVGGEAPPMDAYVDIDQQLEDAGFTSTGAEVLSALDANNDQLLLEVDGPTPTDLLDIGPIPGKCPHKVAGVPLVPPVATPTGVPDPLAATDPCTDPRQRNSNLPFEGRDIIYIHGLDLTAIVERLKGTAGFDAVWPQDKSEFVADGGFWKKRAKQKWSAHIQKYLGHNMADPASRPTNRYLVTSWASTQRFVPGVHAVLSQIAGAMAFEEGVVADASGSTSGFCAQGCVVITQSAGGPIADIAMAVASGAAVSQQLTVANLAWLPQRIDAVVAFAPAYGGSHYATVAAALGWTTVTDPALCETIKWVWVHVFGATTNCGPSQIIADSVLTDLAVPIMESRWRPYLAVTPIPALIVSVAHPTASGRDDATLKSFSPLVKMLFHHGFDDGVLSLDSQCAANGDWRVAPQSYTAEPLKRDAVVNAGMRALGLPRISAGRVYDMGNPDRAGRLYVDQVVGAQIGTPQHWDARNAGTQQAHYDASMYRSASTCLEWFSPTGMIQPVLNGTHPGTATRQRLPNHYSFLMAASDHYTAGVGPYDTACYEVSFGTGRSCAGEPNREEIRVIDDNAVYLRGLVSTAIGPDVGEEIKGRTIKFRWRKKPFRWWKWKRTYHRLGGWQSKVAADYVYQYVLR